MEAHDLESRLIRQATAGQPAALGALLAIHSDELLQYIDSRLPKRVRDLVDPQDVLQDISCSAFLTMRTFDATDSRSVVRWLITIARNRIVDLVRAHRTAKRGGQSIRIDVAAAGNSLVLLLQDLAVYERTPSQSAVTHERAALVQQVIGRLPPDYQRVIRLRYMDGLELDAIAAQMHRSYGATKILCIRALHTLRAELCSASQLI